MGSLPKHQRVAAYAVMLRERDARVEVLLSRLAPRVSRTELWTLPGGGLDHGEDPRAALIREIYEETGLDATVGDTAHVYSAHLPRTTRDGQLVDAHCEGDHRSKCRYRIARERFLVCIEPGAAGSQPARCRVLYDGAAHFVLKRIGRD